MTDHLLTPDMLTIFKFIFIMTFSVVSKPQMADEELMQLEHKQLELELEELKDLDVEKAPLAE